jgi:hypothetical protein
METRVLPRVDLVRDLIIGSLTTENGVHGKATNILTDSPVFPVFSFLLQRNLLFFTSVFY